MLLIELKNKGIQILRRSRISAIMRFHIKRTVYSILFVIALFFLIILTLQNVGIKEYPPLDSKGSTPLEFKDFVHERTFIGRNASNKQLLWADYQHQETTNRTDDLIWPFKHKQWNDRIVNQMKFIPKSYRSDGKLITIYIPGGLGDTSMGQKKFISEQCPVNRCWLSDRSRDRLRADAVIYQNEYFSRTPAHPINQIWILWLLESPINSMDLSSLANKVNWTATYRSDSTIVTPYERFVHFDNFTKLPSRPLKNYTEGKTGLVAWYVSNCNAGNRRWEYALELKKHIQVDIYGACGTLRCSRYDKKHCDELLSKKYKFYLAFENSNCKYYITEKFYWNGLMNDIVPVVMGARKEDYAAVSPPGSFIHVEDFPTATALAQYLLKLDQNPDLYNQYFLWKGTGHFINTKFWCRLCGMLHGVNESKTVRWYRSVERWWRNDRVCTHNRWDDREDRIEGRDWVDLGFNGVR